MVSRSTDLHPTSPPFCPMDLAPDAIGFGQFDGKRINLTERAIRGFSPAGRVLPDQRVGCPLC